VFGVDLLFELPCKLSCVKFDILPPGAGCSPDGSSKSTNGAGEYVLILRGLADGRCESENTVYQLGHIRLMFLSGYAFRQAAEIRLSVLAPERQSLHVSASAAFQNL
jgi:hypothetical protein